MVEIIEFISFFGFGVMAFFFGANMMHKHYIERITSGNPIEIKGKIYQSNEMKCICSDADNLTP